MEPETMIQIEIFTVNPFSENTYLLYNEAGEAVLIDPGFSTPQEQNGLLWFLKGKSLRVCDIWLTHCHIDHILGLAWATAKFEVVPKMHRIEQLVFDRAPQIAEKWFIPYQNYTGSFAYLEPGAILPFGDQQFEVRYVPGHAPGHIAFYNSEGGYVISGDVLFENSIGRTDLPGSDHDTLLQSIQSQLFNLPDATVVWPGHLPVKLIVLHPVFAELYTGNLGLGKVAEKK